MQDRMLLPAGGSFYKANLHCHTVLSDGRWTKEQVKAEYQKRGYSIVAFTDHRHYGWHPELMDEHFIPLAAFEADLNEFFRKPGDFQRVKTYHLNFYDTRPASRGSFTAPVSAAASAGEGSRRGAPSCRSQISRTKPGSSIERSTSSSKPAAVSSRA